MTSRMREALFRSIPYGRQDLDYLLRFFRIMVLGKVVGSTLGVAWIIVTPLLMMALFTFVFGFVFKSRLPDADTSLAFVTWLICGYGPWLAISEGVSRATNAVTANSALIKNLPFKAELLPVAGSLVGLIPLVLALIYVSILVLVDGRLLNVSILIVPVYVLAQFTLISGLGLILGALNVFFRDVGVALPNLLIIALFSSPILYRIERFPEPVQAIMQFNPIYLIGEGYRQPIIYGSLPPTWQIATLAAISAVTILFGLFTFRRLRPYFDSRL